MLQILDLNALAHFFLVFEIRYFFMSFLNELRRITALHASFILVMRIDEKFRVKQPN